MEWPAQKGDKCWNSLVQGVSNSEPRFDLDIPETAIAFANKTANEFHLQSGFVVLNPGAGWVSRQWENRRFGEVAAHIGKKHGLTVVVTWFGDNERLMAREIIQTSSGHAVMAPPSSIWDLAALIEKSHFYVGCDTGPTHLAAALGASCITLFGTTQPQVSGPYQKTSSRICWLGTTAVSSRLKIRLESQRP